MPILVTTPEGLTGGNCDYLNPDSNKMVEEEVTTLGPLRESVDKYERMTKASVPASDASKLIRYSNFLKTRVLSLLETPGCVFIRVFNAIGSDGKHYMFMAPVDNSGNPIKTREAIYLGPCCACPPACIEGGGLP
jgi:hypothetical protein